MAQERSTKNKNELGLCFTIFKMFSPMFSFKIPITIACYCHLLFIGEECNVSGLPRSTTLVHVGLEHS